MQWEQASHRFFLISVTISLTFICGGGRVLMFEGVSPFSQRSEKSSWTISVMFGLNH